MIHQIGINQTADKGYQQKATPIKQVQSSADKPAGDKVSLSYNSATYTSYTVKGTFTVDADSQYYSLKSIVSSMLSEQGMTIDDAIKGTPYVIDEATKEEAANQITEDGFWGVQQTADRIFQFAVNAAGNDPSKLEDIKAAIDEGFGMALDSFGGTLPEISYNTYDAVIEKLDEWAEGEDTKE